MHRNMQDFVEKTSPVGIISTSLTILFNVLNSWSLADINQLLVVIISLLSIVYLVTNILINYDKIKKAFPRITSKRKPVKLPQASSGDDSGDED